MYFQFNDLLHVINQTGSVVGFAGADKLLDDIINYPCDILLPCALEGAINVCRTRAVPSLCLYVIFFLPASQSNILISFSKQPEGLNIQDRLEIQL
ncbi:MAG: hypothetical protein AMJ79_09185 [Phycisphaerae bacterium SM23_30]|nr:MAG: hypothetical protein AMJ79_09185 [Phycisphaerae bacterium SM23_30]